ncbi:hypothetical protein ABHI18_010418 [Aspergillus niger]|jgi:hypothetical protein
MARMITIEIDYGIDDLTTPSEHLTLDMKLAYHACHKLQVASSIVFK